MGTTTPELGPLLLILGQQVDHTGLATVCEVLDDVAEDRRILIHRPVNGMEATVDSSWSRGLR